MVARPDRSVPRKELDLADLSKGADVRIDAREPLQRLLGRPVGLEGLSKLFQPSFPGVRTFAIGVRATPDHAVELTLVGIARDGEPIWTGTRTFSRGPSGALEIHLGFDEVDPRYQSRNITVDMITRELQLLERLDGGPSCRLTIDAEGTGRYVCALHGAVFADETDEGPSPRSNRAMAPAGDRSRIIEAGRALVPGLAKRRQLGKLAIEDALEQLEKITSGWDLARLSFSDAPSPVEVDSDEGIGVRDLGRTLLLDEGTPAWRGALYLTSMLPEVDQLGDLYRRRKTARSKSRLKAEVELARRGLRAGNRAERLRGLKTLGMLGSTELIPELRIIADGKERRTAALARRVMEQIQGIGLPERILGYANDTGHPGRQRALAYRVLAEHFPKVLEPHTAMLRVDPDARIQWAAVPLVARQSHDPGPALAALLAANPAVGPDQSRPGLDGLRLDLIEWLAILADPRTLLPLSMAYQTRPPPAPAEVLALSRALVAFNDPRAKTVLRAGSFPLTRPDVP